MPSITSSRHTQTFMKVTDMCCWYSCSKAGTFLIDILHHINHTSIFIVTLLFYNRRKFQENQLQKRSMQIQYFLHGRIRLSEMKYTTHLLYNTVMAMMKTIGQHMKMTKHAQSHKFLSLIFNQRRGTASGCV